MTTIPVSRETHAKLLVFADTLMSWNRTINLVSKRDCEHIWKRHIDDGLCVADHMPARAAHAIDLGSGSGIPGLIVAMATAVNCTLIEADGRKAAFLREVLRLTETTATVIHGRTESHHDTATDVVMARGYSAIANILPHAYRLLRTGGRCILLKGERHEMELDVARRDWRFVTESSKAPNGVLLQLSCIEPV